MMNMKKTETYSTISWQQQVRQTGEGNHPIVPAENYRAEPVPLDLNQLFLMPLAMMAQRMQGRMMRELDTFSGICNGQARAFDDAYIGQAQRFQEMVSGWCEGIMSEFKGKPK